MPTLYDFTVTTDGHSSCAPGGVSVAPGVDQTFTFSADPGYHVEDVKIDGVSHGSLSSYTFTNVQASHTVDVTSEAGDPTITITAGAGGSASPTGATTVATGDDLSVTFTADVGYCLRRVVVDGVDVGFCPEYTFHGVVSDHTVAVTFTRDFVNAICDALAQYLAGEMTASNGYSVDFSAAGSRVERNPAMVDWRALPRPYIGISYLETSNNSLAASAGVYRAEGDFVVRFFVNALTGATMDKALGERMAATVMQEIMHAVAKDVSLLGVLSSGWIWPKGSTAGQDADAGSVICGGEITFGATWEWSK